MAAVDSSNGNDKGARHRGQDISQATVSEWEQFAAYDTALDCEHIKSYVLNKAKVTERLQRRLAKREQESQHRHKRFMAIIDKKKRIGMRRIWMK